MTANQKAYKEFLKTAFWKTISSAAKDRAVGKCEQCKSGRRLQAHHLIYRKRWEGTLLNDLICLCRKCHIAEHPELNKRRPRDNAKKNAVRKSIHRYQSSGYSNKEALELIAAIKTLNHL